MSRCLALAETFEDVAGIRASFILSSSSRRVVELVRSAGFPCAARLGRDLRDEAGSLARRLSCGDLVVVDDYGVGRNYVRRLRRTADCHVLVIDDLNRWDTGLVDWVLAFPMVAATKPYRHTRAFCGPEYVPLRRAFRAARTGVVAEEGVCLIALGELATTELLCWLVDEVLPFYPHVRVARAAWGGGHRAPSASSSRVELLPPLPDLAVEIARCSTCVCTGGFTKYECIALGRPAVVIDQTHLEHRDTLRLQRRGVLAGAVPAMNSRKLRSVLRRLESASRRAALAADLREAAFGSRATDMAVEILGSA